MRPAQRLLRHVRSSVTTFLVLGGTTAHALDLKIDVPPPSTPGNVVETSVGDVGTGGGEDAPLLPSEALIDEPIVEDPQAPAPADPGIVLDLPPLPQILDTEVIPEAKIQEHRVKAARKAMAPGAGDSKLFPRLACLSDNVDFWSRVYRDLDENEAVLHDKYDLRKIFATVSLPADKPARTMALRAVADTYRDRLNFLADNIENRAAWDAKTREIARLFPDKELTRERVLRSAADLRAQTGLKTRFEAGVQRSLRFLPTVHRIVQTTQLPMDIVNLPHVESSYYPRARSKVGALGLWQLMPGTMRELLGSRAVHQRMDVEISTRAAAKLLRNNYETTRSWPLALTAYNHGLNGVMRAVRQTGSRDLCEIIERYNSPTFKFASSNFYAQFLAAREAALERYTQISKTRGSGRFLKQFLASADRPLP